MIIIKLFIMCILITLGYLLKHGECKNYCNSDFCINSEDNVCKFQGPGPGKDCLSYEKLIKTEKEKQEIVNKINQRRNKVASGDIRSLPPSRNMLKMEWNEELEISAQRWADQCLKYSLDACRDLENERVGQNIATIYGDAPGLTVSTLVDIWYMELLNTNGTIIPRYLPSSPSSLSRYDNFTQLVWAESWRVGCAGVKFREFKTESNIEKNQTVYRLVCNFAPSGNRFGETVYVPGPPCSRCPSDRSCDTEFQNLCSTSKFVLELQTLSNDNSTFNNFSETISITKNAETIEKVNIVKKYITTKFVTEEDSQLDFLSDLFNITRANSLTDQSTLRCNGFLAVDEFIQLLKSRLSNDHILKNLLITSTQQNSPETIFTDRTVAAMINQIYSSKVTATTTKTTVNDYINSTLLVDLVEAVIFRHSDRFSSTEDMKTLINFAPDFSIVKVQAQLGEIKANNEFTGHYFFPEDEESLETSINDESTESYYDPENLAVSEISLEIDDLKRQRETKDFIEDILESYIATENVKDINLPDLNNIRNESQTRKKLNNKTGFPKMLNNIKKYERYKRGIKILKFHSDSFKLTPDGFFVSYQDLLRNLAVDLRNLKLNERHNCAHNSGQMLYAAVIDGSDSEKNYSVILKQILSFQTIPNLTKAPNLKYNIFDKMLSNEMLSIKNHLFVKNSTYASSVYISLQNNVPTPTLELKQKWPIDKVLSNGNLDQHAAVTESEQSSYVTRAASSSSMTVDIEFDNKNEDYKAISKVIEVRSFSVVPVHFTKNLPLKPLCTCMKTNQDTTCSQHCTATGERYHTRNTCTHSDRYINCQAECTRTNLKNILSFTPYPYVYPSYFLGVPTPPANMYYHPDVTNELKVPKHKHRHTNKLSNNYHFFEDNDDLKVDNDIYLENEKVDLEEITAMQSENKKNHKYHKIKPSDKFNSGSIEVLEKDKFIDEVVADLKTYYSDAVIKDCYCSLSTFNLKMKTVYLILTLLVIYIM